MRKRFLTIFTVIVMSLTLLAPVTGTPWTVTAYAKTRMTGVYLINGTLKYYQDGVFTKTTSLARRPSNGKWYYVHRGVVQKVTGVTKKIRDDGKYYYVRNGVFTKPKKQRWTKSTSGDYNFLINTRGRVVSVRPNPKSIVWIDDSLSLNGNLNSVWP